MLSVPVSFLPVYGFTPLQPFLQMLSLIFACVMFGLVTPGVQSGSSDVSSQKSGVKN